MRSRTAGLGTVLVLSSALAACSGGGGGGGGANVNVAVNGSLPANTASSATDAMTSPVQTSSSSAPASEGSSSSSLSTSAPEKYIYELETTPDSNPVSVDDAIQVNGQTYTHALAAAFCPGGERRWTFVLGHKYSSIQGTIGLKDDSPAGITVRYSVLADGKQVFSKDVQVGQSPTINVPVGNALQVKLETVDFNGGCDGVVAEWADIRVVS